MGCQPIERGREIQPVNVSCRTPAVPSGPPYQIRFLDYITSGSFDQYVKWIRSVLLLVTTNEILTLVLFRVHSIFRPRIMQFAPMMDSSIPLNICRSKSSTFSKHRGVGNHSLTFVGGIGNSRHY